MMNMTMKNITRNIILTLTATLLLTACHDDNTISLSATTEDYLGTDNKAYLNNDGYMMWHNPDLVKINAQVCTVHVDNNTATITDITPHSSGKYYAFYPSSWEGTFTQGNQPVMNSIKIPKEHDYTIQGGKQCVNAPMAAFVDNVNSDVLRFKNLGALLRITINNNFANAVELSKITITCNNNNNNLSGEGFEVTNYPSDPKLEKTSGTGNSSTSSTMNIASGLLTIASGSSSVVYFPLPPTGSAADYTFVVQGRSNGAKVTFTRNANNIESFVKNTVYNVPIDLDSNNYTEVKGAAFPGYGTASLPYAISSAEDFATLAQCINNDSAVAGNFTAYNVAHYKLTATAPITLSGFTPIGTPDHPFSGHFNGNNGTIASITTTNTMPYAGLFGYCSGATIKNLTVENATLNATGNGCAVGAICGYATNSLIQQCYLSNTVSASPSSTTAESSNSVGGICGTADAQTTINQCMSSGTIQATVSKTHVGGIAGKIKDSYAKNCTNTATLYGDLMTNSYIGGISGYVQNKSIVSNCNNRGILNGLRAGGVVGSLWSESQVQNCFSAYVNNSTLHGEVVYLNKSGSCSNCYYWGNIVTTNQSTYSNSNCIEMKSMGTTALLVDVNYVPGGGDEEEEEKGNTGWKAGIFGTHHIISHLNAWVNNHQNNGYFLWSGNENDSQTMPTLSCFTNSKASMSKTRKSAPAYARFYQGR